MSNVGRDPETAGDRQGWAGQEMIFISPEKLLMMGDTRYRALTRDGHQVTMSHGSQHMSRAGELRENQGLLKEDRGSGPLNQLLKANYRISFSVLS